jgi:hypothetical protein
MGDDEVCVATKAVGHRIPRATQTPQKNDFTLTSSTWKEREKQEVAVLSIAWW